MISLLAYYQNLPLHIDPIAITLGSFSIGWYGLMYVVGFGVVYLLLRYRIKNDVASSRFPSNAQDLVFDYLLFAIVGAIIAGRLGYVMLYNPMYYWQNLVEIISPYDFVSGRFVGIYGMSYHGGLLGVVLASWIFARKNRLNFWAWADFVVPAVPAGYFFGRIGNFLNLELYGRVTDSAMGMHFPLAAGAGEFLRFPSQLIEATLEGAILFGFLWALRNKNVLASYFVPLYLVGYGAARFVGEFFREPDAQIGYIFSYLTLGQLFSIAMIVVGGFLYHFQKNKKRV